MKYKPRPSELVVGYVIVACLVISALLNFTIKRGGLWREYEMLGWMAALLIGVAIGNTIVLIKMKRSDRQKWRERCMNCGNALVSDCNGVCPHCGLRQN